MSRPTRIHTMGLAVACAVAAATYARPANAACESSFYRSTSTSRSFGDYDVIWANFAGSAYIKGTDYSSGDRIESQGQVTSDARIFGIRKQIVKVTGNAYSYYGSSTGGAINAYALGVNIYYRSWSAPLTYSRSWDRTFFSASQWFFPGGIPVNTTETVTGELGFVVAGGPTTTGVATDFTPWAEAYATGTAAADILVAGVGVTGVMTLLRIDLPVHGQLYLSGNHLNWALRADAVMDSLSGYAKVWVQLLFSIIKYEQTITSWSGYHQTWTLYNASSSTDLCPPSGGGGGGGGGGFI